MKNVMKKDLVIIGGGPAGLTASLYASRSLLDTITLEQEAVGGQVILTNEVDNYPAVPHVDGYTLAEAMRTQAEELGGSIVMESALSITTDPGTGTFHVTSSDAEYVSRAVILAGGATPRRAGFDGEERFAGHGVSYCATCDGMFYRGKRVYVVGGGNSACEEALFLTRFASEVVLVVRKDHVRAQASVARQLDENPKIKIEFETTLVAVGGGELLSWVSLRDERTGQVHTEKYDEGSFGVFVFVGRVPATSLVAGMIDLDETGHVVTDERMATRVPGLFAAGDVRSKALRQIVTAASDGAIAATSVAAYLGQPVEG